MKASLHLTERDFGTAEWGRLVKHVEQRLLELRADLERFDSDPTTTAVTRGRIAELKALATLPVAAQETPARRLARRPVALGDD